MGIWRRGPREGWMMKEERELSPRREASICPLTWPVPTANYLKKRYDEVLGYANGGAAVRLEHVTELEAQMSCAEALLLPKQREPALLLAQQLTLHSCACQLRT
ncbi:unnamed protein product [Leuciscus chuanchicus]